MKTPLVIMGIVRVLDIFGTWHQLVTKSQEFSSGSIFRRLIFLRVRGVKSLEYTFTSA